MVYLYDNQRIIETRDGSDNVVQQFIHGTKYVDELVMVRVKDKGDLYVHQAERDQCGSLKDWNLIGATDMAGRLVERYAYRPYGELTAHAETGFGDYDGDGEVDGDDRAAIETGGACLDASPPKECRVLDLDFDGDYDSNDRTLFDALPQGNARHPGRVATSVEQPFGHQGLLFDAELSSYQNRARQYNAASRFLQSDPAGYRDSLSHFVYLRSNPHKHLDPTGRNCCIHSGYGNDGGPVSTSTIGWLCCTCYADSTCSLDACVDPEFARATDPGVADCVYQHERDHMRRWSCRFTVDGCRLETSSTSAQWDECNAYRVEEQCLEGMSSSSNDRYDRCNFVKCMVDRICAHRQEPYGVQRAADWCSEWGPDYGGCHNS